MGPCAVRPEFQQRGAGSAVIRAVLRAAREQGGNLVLVLGHAEYYPRFGFVPASRYVALVADPAQPVPAGTIRYAAAFGI